MSATFRVFTIDGIPLYEDEYDDEYAACEKLSEIEETGVVAQVIIGEDVYAERYIP